MRTVSRASQTLLVTESSRLHRGTLKDVAQVTQAIFWGVGLGD
jgi:hypothetical protein